MMPAPPNLMLLGLLIIVAPPPIGMNGLGAIMRSHSLPLIRTLMDHGPMKPRMSAKHDLSVQHLHFMLELYKRSADGDGRPKASRPAGAAVRLVRPVHQAPFISEKKWKIQNLKFNLRNLKTEELVKATVMYPRTMYFGDSFSICKVDPLPSAGLFSKTRVPPGIRMWAETDITSHIRSLLEDTNQSLHVQLVCRRIGKRNTRSLGVSASHIPFLLIYFNPKVHNQSTEKVLNTVAEKAMPHVLNRKPRQVGTFGIKLPKISNQSEQLKNHCSLRPFWVSFHQLGWDHWIIAPHRYNPGYCKGDCPKLLHSGYNSPNHAIIQNFINQVVDGNVPRPSCVPYSYGPISVLMIEPGGNILYKEYENMIAESCTCR
ncbi:bone morphogenetic protein 15 [Hyla sarda]|uniref:bone morphogenetic protein 15 n=1 Tax=Hyla sarda TaxID=327740 RepID=UPI0024C268F0|nr:bone morphogenetic protein 15 [Hyla sarda]